MTERRDYWAEAVERVELCSDTRVGSVVDRIVLADGQRLVVKRVFPADNLLLSMTGDDVGREYVAWTRGLLDALPRPISHPVVDGWLDGDSAVLVMNDLGEDLIGCTARVSAARCRELVGALATMHRAFLGAGPEGLTPLSLHLGMYAPGRMRMYAGGPDPLPETVLEGWGAFEDLVRPEIGSAVFELLADPEPLAQALLTRPCTLIHGNLAAENIAMTDGSVALIDWACIASAPPALDLARLLTRSSRQLALSRDEVLVEYRRAAGDAFDAEAMQLATLSCLLFVGWRGALAVTRRPDEASRQQAWAELQWWIREGRAALDAGLV